MASSPTPPADTGLPCSWEPLRDAVIEALRDGGIGQGATSPYLLAVLERS